MTPESQLTPTEILASASKVLVDNGYSHAERMTLPDWRGPEVRIFEDPYSIAAVLVFDTWKELSDRWPDAQGAFVQLISQYISRSEAKAWEGYLILVTPGITADQQAIANVRYDTSRLRKLVATGEELRDLSDVERTLLPLLPLAPHEMLQQEGSALDLLPALLEPKGISKEATQRVVEAFHNRIRLSRVLLR